MKQACAALALLVLAGGAAAQYPERPIRMIVPQAAPEVPTLDKLNRAINASIVAPGTKERFAQLGSEGGGGTPRNSPG